jgi:hypothetical protein
MLVPNACEFVSSVTTSSGANLLGYFSHRPFNLNMTSCSMPSAKGNCTHVSGASFFCRADVLASALVAKDEPGDLDFLGPLTTLGFKFGSGHFVGKPSSWASSFAFRRASNLIDSALLGRGSCHRALSLALSNSHSLDSLEAKSIASGAWMDNNVNLSTSALKMRQPPNSTATLVTSLSQASLSVPAFS